MRVTFYIDLPPYKYAHSDLCLYAVSRPSETGPPLGWKRYAFTVDLPTRQFDEALPPAGPVFEVPR